MKWLQFPHTSEVYNYKKQSGDEVIHLKYTIIRNNQAKLLTNMCHIPWRTS